MTAWKSGPGRAMPPGMLTDQRTARISQDRAAGSVVAARRGVINQKWRNGLHVPVLLQEMLQAIRPRSGGVYLDGTLGAGGYARAILEGSEPDGMVVGLDLDPSAVSRASRLLAHFGERFRAIHRGFQMAPEVLQSLGISRIDGAVLDLGLSSDQLEDPERGFSFRLEGPLDMRFDTSSGEPLLDYLETVPARELESILATYGEERHHRKVALRLIEALNRGKLHTTVDLANQVRKVVSTRGSRIDPATRTFQALRIALNRELENLDRALEVIPMLLNPGARFCVVSYHSLEDRRVKIAFRERQKDSRSWAVVTRKPIRPTAEEIGANPRSRSARMRVLEATKVRDARTDVNEISH